MTTTTSEFLERILGFDNKRAVGASINLIHTSITNLFPIILCGDGDLVPVARSLHQYMNPGPFIVCDPRRHQTGSTVRNAENYEHGMVALAAATGGTLCIRAARPPRDIDMVMASNEHTQLIVCSNDEPWYVTAIRIPSIVARKHEIDRIITAYAADAMHRLARDQSEFATEDREWVKRYACYSLSEIEKATMRLAALRIADNPNNAANLCGMARISLVRWKERREHEGQTRQETHISHI